MSVIKIYLYLLIAGSFSGQDSDKMGISMSDIQCLLDKEGASELVIDVIVNTKNDRIFSEGILLGIALLEGGNTQTQVPAHHDERYICYLCFLLIFHRNQGKVMHFLLASHDCTQI